MRQEGLLEIEAHSDLDVPVGPLEEEERMPCRLRTGGEFVGVLTAPSVVLT
jgi:hypothetical protein